MNVAYIKNYNVEIDIFEKKEITPLHIINQNQLPDNGDIINILANEDEKNLFEKIKNKSFAIKEISTVYKLYELTSEEIKLIETK